MITQKKGCQQNGFELQQIAIVAGCQAVKWKETQSMYEKTIWEMWIAMFMYTH